jgi:hypothetical protein
VVVWHQLGVFHNERQRYAQAEATYAQALALQPDMADTYYARAKNLREWGLALLTSADAGERAEGVAHLRQARVHALTSLGLHYPPASMLLALIQAALAQSEPLTQTNQPNQPEAT